MMRRQPACMNMIETSAQLYMGMGLLLALANLLAFIAFAIDKGRAERNEWRIPESFLLKLAFLGGWPGAKLGQWVFRHKTRKQPFGWHLNLIGAFQVLCVAAGFGVAYAPSVDFEQVTHMAMAVIAPAPAESADEVMTEAAKMPKRFGPGSDKTSAIHRLTP